MMPHRFYNMRRDEPLEEGPTSYSSSQDESHKYMMDAGNNLDMDNDDEQLDRRQIEVIEEMIADEDDHKVLVNAKDRFIESSQEKSATARKLSAQLESSLLGSKDKVFGLVTAQQDS